MSARYSGGGGGGGGSGKCGVGYLQCRMEYPCKEGGARSCPQENNSVSVRVEVKEGRRGKEERKEEKKSLRICNGRYSVLYG